MLRWLVLFCNVSLRNNTNKTQPQKIKIENAELRKEIMQISAKTATDTECNENRKNK